MRTTASDDKQFISEVIPSSLLEDSIEFIKNKYSAEEIFGRDSLIEWAEENGYVKEE